MRLSSSYLKMMKGNFHQISLNKPIIHHFRFAAEVLIYRPDN